MKKIELVDFLKGFSISTIVLMHLIQNYLYMPKIINIGSSLGGAGVHVFILCSGFGLYYSYLHKKITFKDFIMKRFKKVYVPYIIVVLISAIFPFMYPYQDKFMALLSHIFLFKMFNAGYESSFGFHFWFISTIIQVYLIFNILALLKDKINSNKKFIFIMSLISVVWWVFTAITGKTDTRIWNSFFLQYIWEFSLGMLLAEGIYKDKIDIKCKSNLKLFAVSIIALCLYGVIGAKGGTLKVFNDVPSLVGYGGLALFIYNLNIKLINKIILKISGYSYELYLVHILIFSCVFKIVNNRIPQILTAVMAIVISIAVAKIYHYILIMFKEINRHNEIKFEEEVA